MTAFTTGTRTAPAMLARAGCLAACLFAATRPAHAGERVLYSFQGPVAGDGAYPEAGLIFFDGAFYGTTNNGGASGYGTVFKLTKAGSETVLYSFQGVVAGDGAFPLAGLIDVQGALYGTTFRGGANGYGTVFKVTTTGAEKVVYSFLGAQTADDNDGAYPTGGLLNVNGTLYGTTVEGGTYNAGTAFKLSLTGAELPIHDFGGNLDGADPDGGLIDVGGTLYGTTEAGGEALLVSNGTAFELSLTTPHNEIPFVSFGADSATDGASPEAGLVSLAGTFYGTTQGGGTYGYGTIYSTVPFRSYTSLYAFQGSAAGDGAYPVAGLVIVGGTLYGTTDQGGASGYGTVFVLKP